MLRLKSRKYLYRSSKFLVLYIYLFFDQTETKIYQMLFLFWFLKVIQIAQLSDCIWRKHFFTSRCNKTVNTFSRYSSKLTFFLCTILTENFHRGCLIFSMLLNLKIQKPMRYVWEINEWSATGKVHSESDARLKPEVTNRA